MKLTPQEILSHKFNTKLRGLDPDEVRQLLAEIAEDMETEIYERERAEEEISRLNNQINQTRKKEELLQETLISAQKFSDEIRKNAEKDAELIIKDAEIKADEITNKVFLRQKEISEGIKNLKFKRTEIEHDIINMLTSLKELITSYRKEDDEFDKIEYLGK